MHLVHPIPPFIRPDSRILILGSFPSVKSRESGFYYGNPQNRFWGLLATLFSESLPSGNDGKRQILERHRIALWDVIRSCEITGSSDASIREAAFNPIEESIRNTNIRIVLLNGKTAGKLYEKGILSKPDLPAVGLPSTSAANAAFSMDKLLQEWKAALVYPK